MISDTPFGRYSAKYCMSMKANTVRRRPSENIGKISPRESYIGNTGLNKRSESKSIKATSCSAITNILTTTSLPPL
jgi:hypothetical protein